jgi:cell division septation protein DedD
VSDLSNDATDDGFHEIQLSGKQLVFLFMATTVVSVVIFLCGVLVGRGVRGEALAANTVKPAAVAAAGPQPTTDVAPSSSAAPPNVSEDPKPADNDKLSYNGRLTAEKPAPENLKPKATETTEAVVAQPAPASTPPPASAPNASSDATVKNGAAKGSAPVPTPVAPPAPPPNTTAPARNGLWAVQVVALTDRAAAQAVVDRLAGKGYPAFLVPPQASAAVKNYKVQIGRFEDRGEAQTVANRLKAEEQFEPWILR